jgi:hypothetical protein
LDFERVRLIKELIFDIHRVATGEDKVNVDELIDAFAK